MTTKLDFPSPTAQGPEEGACDTCKGFRVVNIDDWRQQPCPDCTPSAKAGAVSSDGSMVAIEEIAANDYLAPSVYRHALQQLLRMYQALRSTPAPDVQEKLDVDSLAQVIRKVDGNHDLGAGALAEAIVAAFAQAKGES